MFSLLQASVEEYHISNHTNSSAGTLAKVMAGDGLIEQSMVRRLPHGTVERLERPADHETSSDKAMTIVKLPRSGRC